MNLLVAIIVVVGMTKIWNVGIVGVEEDIQGLKVCIVATVLSSMSPKMKILQVEIMFLLMLTK